MQTSLAVVPSNEKGESYPEPFPRPRPCHPVTSREPREIHVYEVEDGAGNVICSTLSTSEANSFYAAWRKRDPQSRIFQRTATIGGTTRAETAQLLEVRSASPNRSGSLIGFAATADDAPAVGRFEVERGETLDVTPVDVSFSGVRRFIAVIVDICAMFFAPRSPFELPPCDSVTPRPTTGEFCPRAYEWRSRAEVLAEVFEHNAERMRELIEADQEGRDPDSMEWLIPIEVSETTGDMRWTWHLHNGVGHIDEMSHKALRLVIPTADELAKLGTVEADYPQLYQLAIVETNEQFKRECWFAMPRDEQSGPILEERHGLTLPEALEQSRRFNMEAARLGLNQWAVVASEEGGAA